MPPASETGFQARVTATAPVAVARSPPGAGGAVVSAAGSRVVAVTAVELAETLPRESLARTVNVYAVRGVRPEIVAAGSVTVAAGSVPRWTSYPAIGKSVATAGVQRSDTVVVVRPATVSPVGVPGARSALPSHLSPLTRQLSGAACDPVAMNQKLYGSVVPPAATVPL
ncbi:hypothetical protein GCM10010166_50880 [Couchioplanes caeruleus subsp. azureus]|nr:hypothetical protein GCM10010166_50880 [Couchioplanes caeruleus subsp. azureus]